MLKITPYIASILVIVAIGGLWYPLLGYFMLVVFATLLIISPFKGRWFCGNLCPRGSFNDFWLSKFSRKKQIPNLFKSLAIRIPIIILMMGFMFFRLFQTKGLINQIGMVFVIMCLSTTIIAIFLGIYFSPRAWCTFCPMGTIQRFLGKDKHRLKCHSKQCIKCQKCKNVCPMQLNVNEIIHNPDCIKCGRCIQICPTKALYF